MPIWLRRLTFFKIREFYENENNPNQGDIVSQNRKVIKSAETPLEPSKVNVPSYVVKASKK